MPHVQRMVEEHSQLSDRVAKLKLFVSGETFPLLTITERYLMELQLSAMKSYECALSARLSLAKEKKNALSSV